LAKLLFLYPLYFNPNSLKRLQKYLECEKTNHSFEIAATCSNDLIFESAQDIANKIGLNLKYRKNYGGGEGIFYWVQHNYNLQNFDYIWYFEESCEPIKPNWLNHLIAQLDSGIPLTGWNWNAFSKRRSQSTQVIFRNKIDFMIASINSANSGADSYGNSLEGVWDTPGYRHETLVFRKEDFQNFKFDNPAKDFYLESNDPRYYGIRSERLWWPIYHPFTTNFKVNSPNLQWSILMKHGYVPPLINQNKKYFREISKKERLYLYN
jgi:hypothetical protein